MKKLIKDGLVAVLISPGFGAGWSTWHIGETAEEMIFDADIAQMVLDKADSDNIEAVAKTKWPNEYFGAAEDLEVHWIKEGSHFIVTEYDGSESIMFRDEVTWNVT